LVIGTYNEVIESPLPHFGSVGVVNHPAPESEREGALCANLIGLYTESSQVWHDDARIDVSLGSRA
jgi:hypothetical protein